MTILEIIFSLKSLSFPLCLSITLPLLDIWFSGLIFDVYFSLFNVFNHGFLFPDILKYIHVYIYIFLIYLPILILTYIDLFLIF